MQEVLGAAGRSPASTTTRGLDGARSDVLVVERLVGAAAGTADASASVSAPTAQPDAVNGS